MKLPREYEFKCRDTITEDYHDNLISWWLYYQKQSTGWHIRFNGYEYYYDNHNEVRFFYDLKVAQMSLVEDFSKKYNLPYNNPN